jgi:DNA-binding CsgD family transcriptional regulator
MGKNWTCQEIQYLKESWGKIPLKQIMGGLQRTEDSVMRKARRLGLNVRKLEEEMLKKKWSKEEDHFIVENYKMLKTESISRHLKRTVTAIRKRAVYLGIGGEAVRWTAEEAEYLKERWGIVNLDTIAKKLNRSRNSVILKAYQMSLREQVAANGVYLTPADISSILNINIRTLYTWIRNGMIKHRKFKVGNKKKYQISVDAFCKFIEDYQNKWNSMEADIDLIKSYYVSYFICEDGTLTLRGSASRWLEKKIIEDKQGYKKLLKPWTCKEENLLLNLLEEGYSYKEMCHKLGRTIGSTKTKLYMLKSKANCQLAGMVQ